MALRTDHLSPAAVLGESRPRSGVDLAMRLDRRRAVRALGVMSLGLIVSGCAGRTDVAPAVEFPRFVYSSSSSLAGYQIAVRHGDLLAVLPCYCGCVAINHQNLKDCFISPGGDFDRHASGCNVCLDEAKLAASLQQSGQTPKQIRVAIDRQFGHFGNPTHTMTP